LTFADVCTKLGICALVSLCAFAPMMSPADEPTAIHTIDELWAEFDPHKLPLEVEVLKHQDDADVHLETIYFTGEVFDGEKTRVFGYFGRPLRSEGKLPGILHIHGGGQAANLDWARFWAKRGYGALSFDFCGDTNLPNLGPEYRREHFTRWAKVPADMMKVGGGRQMESTPRHNPWFHWTMAARRGLTLLESRPEVDGKRLGIFGISVGGTLTWIVAGVDSRVRAAAPIYGCGWESYHEFPPQPAASVDESTRLWRTLIAPEAHAARIRCPVLFFSATDDFHGKLDLAYETLDLLPKDVIRGQVITANYDHHIEPIEARSLPLWMDCQLKGIPESWPATPRIEISVADATPVVRVTPAEASQVVCVDVFYALNNDWPMTRFWRRATAQQSEDGTYVAAAPVVSGDDIIFALANVTYRSAIRISSRLVKRSVDELPGARPSLSRSAMIDTMDTATDWNWVPAYTDPKEGDTSFFGSWKDGTGERGFTLDAELFNHQQPMKFFFGTRKFGDPQFRAATGAQTLLIDVLAENLPQALTVRVKHRLPKEYGQEFAATWDLAKEEPEAAAAGAPTTDKWRTLRMARAQFHTTQGIQLPDWEHVEYFMLDGTAAANRPPVFKRLRWEE
jgi:dienelactone hydrolase